MKQRIDLVAIEFICSLYKYVRFLYHKFQYIRRYGRDYGISFRPIHKGDSVNILANGPSLTEELQKIKYSDTNAVVNFFANSDIYSDMKPQYYFIADPAFFSEVADVNLKRKIEELINNINSKTNWNMTLIIPIEYKDKFNNILCTNKKIHFEYLPSLQFEGFERKRFKNYTQGCAGPSYVNVSLFALFYLLNKGYSKINLYGVDHTFLQGVGVDEQNWPCIEDHHFYGTTSTRIVRKHEDGHYWDIADFIYDKYLTFKEHKLMRKYADYLGAEIINCTKNSWIDAYTRLSQIEHK